MAFLIEIILLGLKNLMLHKLRSLLTALGIIFGVAAVITMVAIGEGNKRKVIADIESLGARNIIVRSVKPSDNASRASGTSSRTQLLAYGILRQDLRRIQASVQPVSRIVALKQVSGQVSYTGRKASAAVFGTSPDLLDVTMLKMSRGRFITQADMEAGDNIIVLGAEIAERLYPLEDPIDSTIFIGPQSFRVVGVMNRVGLAGGAGSALVGRDLNFDAYIPMTTALTRFGDVVVQQKAGSFEATKVEISELYLETPSTDDVRKVSNQVLLILDKNHDRAGDVSTIVPQELLEQAERTQRLFNTLMVMIASISLLVGGIGIMNIMLASVTERTREIGIRRALGASRYHIISQFLIETTVLSGIGGLIGVGLGVGAAVALMVVHYYAPSIEKPHITAWSIFVSFGVAAGVGIVFGLYPAVRASQQDPIVALRHD
jgi:putative ABC transport system permease protein